MKSFLYKFPFNNIIKIQILKEYSNYYFILFNRNNLLLIDKGSDDLDINIPEENFSELKVNQIDEVN